jgi:hypothetical protein
VSRGSGPWYEVTINAHDVPPRYRIEAQTHQLPAHSEKAARAAACRRAHIATRMPPWKPYLRVTYRHSSARILQVKTDWKGDVTLPS